MAVSADEIKQQIEEARSILQSVSRQTTFLNSEVSRGALPGDPDFIDRRANNLNEQVIRALDILNQASDAAFDLEATESLKFALLGDIDTLESFAIDTQARLIEVVDGAEENQNRRNTQQTAPRNSASEIVENEQDAKAEGANVQSPQQEDLVLDDQNQVVTQPTNVNTGTNAREPDTSDDGDSNPPVSGSDFGNQSSGGTSNVGGDAAVVRTQQTQGTSAPDEDAVAPTQNVTATSAGSDGRVEVAKEFLQPIINKPNLLSGLSSMTYSLSLYLMSPDEFSEFTVAENKILPGSELLMQSAGAPKGERNEWFNVDFYIEDFELESVVGTQAVGSPHNAVSLKFNIIEPTGITLLNRLNNAVIDKINSQEEKKRPSAFAQTYLMVIRFYGYDAAGNPVTAADLGLSDTTDKNAVIEKFIPFMISNLSYKITTKSTEYNIQGVCHGTNVAFSTQRGVIPFNVQLTAASVDQLFNGNAVLTETQNENTQNTGNNQTGSTQTVVQGLIQALNEQQQRLAGESYEIADEYEIIFQDTDIKNSKLTKPGNVSKGSATNQTSTQSAQRYLQSKLNYDKESRSWNVPAGMSIAQLLDLVLRTSSYVTKQQDIYIDEKTGKPVGPKDPDSKPASVPTVQWYRIKSKVSPLGYDNKRSAIAYKITYIINKYQINTPRSPYFPPAEYRGVHKLYNYWFTGKNTEVLDFEIDVNTNYFMVIGNDGRIDERDPGKFPVQQSYSPATGQTQQGGERGSTIPAANLSDRLYSAADVASGVIQIVGDPDWIQQTELVYNKSLSLSPFAPDGGVNYDSSEVLFELRFNPVQDYDLATGLSNVYENNRDINIQTKDGILTESNVAQESLVWAATTVTSTFSDGKFIQRLEGVYRDFNSSKNAPVNPQERQVLSNGNTVEQSLAQREVDSEDTSGTVVGGVVTGAGGAGNRIKAQNQRDNLNSGSPKTGVPTKNTGGRQYNLDNPHERKLAREEANRIRSSGGTPLTTPDGRVIDTSATNNSGAIGTPTQTVDDDGGTVVGGRSNNARQQ